MAKDFQPAPDRATQPPDGQRLESWKEIATYLNREVRTVQRWEKHQQLPIHRLSLEKRSPVYAYTAELDTWRNKARCLVAASAEPESRPVQDTAPNFRRHKWFAALVATSVAAMGVYLSLGRRPTHAAFHQRDWVLIANFQNKTGETAFDGLVEAAMNRDLSNSSFINIVPPERVADALLLMKKPSSTPIDAQIGREICLRDGGIRALLEGEIEKTGSSYVLTADLIDPKGGSPFARARQTALDQNAVLDAALQLSEQLRSEIREPLPPSAQANATLEQATTPSLRALELYSQGMAQINQSSWEAAAMLLEQAVQQDPQFASAHIYLAHCYSNLGKDDLAAPHYRQAFALTNTTTDRERYFILGSYYDRFAKDREKAIEAYKTLVSLYPDDYWGNRNLAELVGYGSLFSWRSEEALPYIVRRAELRPTGIDDNWRASQALAITDSDLVRAENFASRLQGLLSSPETIRRNPQAAVWAEFLPARKAWLQGNPTPLLEECDRLRRTMDLQTGPAHEEFSGALAAAYMALGRFKAAWELQNNYEDPAERYISLAFNSYARDDEPELKRQLLNLTPFDSAETPELAMPLLARTGATFEAQRLLSLLQMDSWYSGPVGKAMLMTFQGELVLARGERGEGIRLLQNSLDPKENYYTFAWGSEDLAHAWEIEGNLPQAIAVLENATKDKYRMLWGVSNGFLWVHLQGELAQLYRKAGRDEDAERTESELRRLLAYADPDDPLLLRLKQSKMIASEQRR